MKQRFAERWRRWQQTPFGALVAHFMLRLFASEDEQGSNSLGFGLGAVLAMVASPGAFASIVLLAKYSTLLQWLRGQRLDAIQRSPSDEHFFIVLSMTVTGLLMVARWNRLFPDRRDFANLAGLPIAIRNIFLANLTALIALAVLFGAVVNGVSAVLFPFIVTLSIGTLASFSKVAAAHAVSVFGASLFSFFAVFALVGVLSLFLPRRLFRPVSLAVRILLVVVLLSEIFSNGLLEVFARGQNAANILAWIPSLWFLGFYEHFLGIARPMVRVMEARALISLAVCVFVSIAAYALCYRRIFVRLPETLDMFTGSRALLRIRFPELLLRPLFRSPFERACQSFAWKVLTRSETHMLFFGAYLGVGLVLVAQGALAADGGSASATLPSASWLGVPALIALFIVTGMRFVFDLPAVREANWVFCLTSDNAEPPPRRLAKRFLLWATLPWQLLLFLPLSAIRVDWPFAILHISFVIACTLLFIDLLLVSFRKIPFTCRTQLEVRQFLTRMLTALFAVVVLAPALASLERWMLAAPLRFIWPTVLFAAAWLILSRVRDREEETEQAPIFEDLPPPPFEVLNLT